MSKRRGDHHQDPACEGENDLRGPCTNADEGISLPSEVKADTSAALCAPVRFLVAWVRGMGSQPQSFPVAIKGVVVSDGAVLLLKNERDERELPGGKIEVGESPEDCLVRELHEETGWSVAVEQILDSWVYPVRPTRSVFIVTYVCSTPETAAPRVSAEHRAIGLFRRDELVDLCLPDGYRRSIVTWFAHSSRIER